MFVWLSESEGMLEGRECGVGATLAQREGGAERVSLVMAVTLFILAPPSYVQTASIESRCERADRMRAAVALQTRTLEFAFARGNVHTGQMCCPVCSE